MFTTIGFIGCGNMGGALARAVRTAAPGAQLFFANRSAEKAEALARELGGTAADNETLARTCSLLVLGVKPQLMGQMLAGLAPVLAARSERVVLLTMAAGLTTQTIRDMAGGEYPVIRIMPNTPVSVGAGVVQLCSLGATREETRAVTALLSGAGLVDELEESLMDAATALSGCGPAFVDLFLEALSAGGAACGLPEDKALTYAVHTLLGAARLQQETGLPPAQLRQAVCSPGGATIQGVYALEQGELTQTVVRAVEAAYKRALELK
ncbi:MAG: pyrroline-5-carboxylate reductase [Oscillospiraceae bacterium]|nr:pyrroline-5-carboxylate reductase [Oscillospiraceae bacterium]